MKRQNIKRTALLAALSVSIIIFGAIVFTPHENDDTFVEIKPIFTPEVVHMELPMQNTLIPYCRRRVWFKPEMP